MRMAPSAVHTLVYPCCCNTRSWSSGLRSSPGGEGRHEHHALCAACENVVHHVRHAVFPHHLAGDGGLGDPDAREEHAQVVHDLGAGDGERAARGAALLNGHGRREAVDSVDVGLIESAEKLTGVTAQTLHVSTLAFGVQRVERQAALARTAKPCDHRQFLLGNADADVFQIVHARTVDVNLHCSF